VAMIYLVLAVRPSLSGNRVGDVRRFECLGILATAAIASGWRERGWAVTVLKPVGPPA
jgi:hypothetical protein